MVIYDGAPHSFFDRTFAEHEAACDDAWRQILGFVGVPLWSRPNRRHRVAGGFRRESSGLPVFGGPHRPQELVRDFGASGYTTVRANEDPFGLA